MPDHEAWLTNWKGSPAVIAVDLAWREHMPDPSRPYLARVSFELVAPDEHGLPTIEEQRTLGDVGRRLDDELVYQHDGAVVGWVTWQGRRDLFVYLPLPVPLEATLAALIDPLAPEHAWSVAIREERDWQTYREVLLPDDPGMQQILTWRGVDELVKAGDNLSHPRPVRHLLWFPDEEKRERLASRAEADGWRAWHAERVPDTDLPWGLVVETVSPADRATLQASADALYTLAIGLGGRYDGWTARPAGA